MSEELKSAKEISLILSLNPNYILSLFRLYGIKKVMSIRKISYFSIAQIEKLTRYLELTTSRKEQVKYFENNYTDLAEVTNIKLRVVENVIFKSKINC
jgi:hypothetical protein